MPGALTQDFQVEQYITSFRASSDRVRWVLYALLLTSAVLVMLTWNTRPGGWVQRRLDRAAPLQRLAATYQFAHEAAGRDQNPALMKSAMTAKQLRQLEENYLRLKLYEEYTKQVVARDWLVTVPPLFGVTIDANELGWVSGQVLLVLMLLLFICLVRQHENLYLCAFKIRRLHAAEDGESDANFLYHALVMGQVLNHPPTLARWQHGTGALLLTLARFVTIFAPVLAYWYVVHTDVVGIIEQGLPMRNAVIKLVMLAGLVVLAFFAMLYVTACERKWRHVFFDINPSLRSQSQRRWSQWVDWPRLRMKPRELLAFKQLNVPNETSTHALDEAPLVVTQVLRLGRPPERAPKWYRKFWYYRARRRMACLLYRAARRKLRESAKTRDYRLTAVDIAESCLIEGRWTVTASWSCQRDTPTE